MSYVVYILKCADNTLYTGITNNMEKRLHEHNDGDLGAKYTKNRRPVKVVYQEKANDRSDAQSREYAIRQLSRTQKQLLVKEYKNA